MRVWLEIPDGTGWGPLRVIRASLERAGYHTEEHRVAGHLMIQVTGSRPERVSYPPAWRGARLPR
jgi:hypothetical protein